MSKKNDQKMFDVLIPELKKWNHGKGVDPENWIYMMGRYDLAIGYSLLFWPRFVEYDGYVLRKGFNKASLRGFEAQRKNNRVAVEAVMNSIEMVDIHGNEENPNEEQLRYLGGVLLEIHKIKLAADYPMRKFEVVFDDEYDLTFWQIE